MDLKVITFYLILSNLNDFVRGNTEDFVIKDILKQLKDVKAIVKLQQAQILRLNDVNKGLIGEIEELKIREDDQQSRIRKLEYGANTEYAEPHSNGKHVTDNQLMGKDTSEFKDRLQRDDSQTRQIHQEQPVAFFATRAGNAEHLGQNQVVVFDNVITNIGDAYHSNIGVFTAPIDGVYVFSTSLLLLHESAHFRFTINGRPVSSMFASSTDTYETVSQTAIFNLKKGDNISINNVDVDKFVHGDHHSTFSGFLLNAAL